MTPSPMTAPSQDGLIPDRLGRTKFLLFLVALLWPAQLLTASGILGGIVQPAIAQQLQTTQIAWFSLAFTIAATLTTPFAAKLGDIHGRKKVMIVIAAIGLIGDLIVVLAPTFELMVLGRVIAGFYGPIIALAFAMARDVFPPKQVGQASGLIGASLGLVAFAAPFIGGFLFDGFGYHGPLWFVVAGTAIALVLLFTLPESPKQPSVGRFDVLGGTLLGVGILAIIWGIGQITSWGFDLRTIGVIAGGLAILVVFLFVERRVANPLFDTRIIARREVLTVLLSTSIIAGTIYAAAILITFIGLFPAIPGVSAGKGWTALYTALIGAPYGLLIFLTGLVAGRFLSRVDGRVVWRIGGALTALGFVLIAFFHADEVQIILSTIPLGLGSGLIVSMIPVLILGAVSEREQGMASGTSTLLNNVFTALITAVMFVVLAANGVAAEGTVFFSENSFRFAWLTMAGFVVLGLLAGLAIPRLLKPNEVEAGRALTGSLPTTR